MLAMNKILTMVAAAIFLAACDAKNTDSNVNAPGEEKSNESKLLNAGADLLQDKSPLNAFNTYLDGFHFYNGNINAQWKHIITCLSLMRTCTRQSFLMAMEKTLK
jgi:hypothetical protein